MFLKLILMYFLFIHIFKPVALIEKESALRILRITKEFKINAQPNMVIFYRDDTINAFMDGNGRMCVLSGIVRALTPEELIFVIGHELGHFVHKHVLRTIQHIYANSGLFTGLALGGLLIGGALPACVIQSIFMAHVLEYSKFYEYQADRFALDTLISNALPLQGAILIQERFKRDLGHNWDSGKDYFSTHPLPQHRKEALLGLIKKIKTEKPNYNIKNFNKDCFFYKQLSRIKAINIKVKTLDDVCIGELEEGHKYAFLINQYIIKTQYQRALPPVEKLEKLEPDNVFIYMYRAYIYRGLKYNHLALLFFEKFLTQLKPDEVCTVLEIIFDYGKLLMETKKFDKFLALTQTLNKNQQEQLYLICNLKYLYYNFIKDFKNQLIYMGYLYVFNKEKSKIEDIIAYYKYKYGEDVALQDLQDFKENFI